MPYKKQKAIRSNKKRCHLRPNDRFGVSAYLILPIGLLLFEFGIKNVFKIRLYVINLVTL